MNEHPIDGLMSSAMSNIKDMVDVNTVVGDPVIGEAGTLIIPLSKIGIGFVAGGAEYTLEKSDLMPFGGGGGAGMSVTPCGFLVISNGNVSFLSAQQNDALDKILNNMPQIIREVKNTLNDLDILKDEDENQENM